MPLVWVLQPELRYGLAGSRHSRRVAGTRIVSLPLPAWVSERSATATKASPWPRTRSLTLSPGCFDGSSDPHRASKRWPLEGEATTCAQGPPDRVHRSAAVARE